MDRSSEQSAITPLLSETTLDKQVSVDHSLNSDKTIDEVIPSTINDTQKKQNVAPKPKKIVESVQWQDRTKLSQHVATLVDDPVQKELLSNVFFDVTAEDLTEGRKKRTIVKKEEVREPPTFDHNRSTIDNITNILDSLDSVHEERLITPAEASARDRFKFMEQIKKEELVAIIHNLENKLNYKVTEKDFEDVSLKDSMGQDHLSHLELKIAQKKCELKELRLAVQRYKNLRSTVSANKLFADFVSKHESEETKIHINELISMKKDMDSMHYQMKKLYQSEQSFFASLLSAADIKEATSTLKKEVATIFYPKARDVLKNTKVKREAPPETEQLDKPVKKQKKKATKPKAIEKVDTKALELQKRIDYENEVNENYMDSVVVNTSSDHPTFGADAVDGVANSFEVLHYYDILGKTTLSPQLQKSSAIVDVVISAIYPTVTEKYIIHSNPNIGTKNNFSIDSLMVIYDLMQLNNLIFFNRKLQALNDLIYSFYKELYVRNNSSKYDVTRFPIFVEIINKYNNFVKGAKLSKSKMLRYANTLYMQEKLPKYLCNFICNYVYGRTIIPEARKLSKYVGFSDKTYGELLPDFLSMVFEKCHLDYNSSYVDLGCGIGNTNYYAGLLANVASSFGCEIMENPSDLCVKYGDYFKKMVALFGFQNHTDYSFSLKKSFMGNEEVVKKLQTCDVLLLNNFIFSGDINIAATRLVKNLPIGAKVIHLKPLMTIDKSAMSKVTRARVDYNLNKKVDNYVLVDESDSSSKKKLNKDEPSDQKANQYLKDEDLEANIREMRDSFRIRHANGKLNKRLNEDSDNLVEVTKLLLDDKVLVSFKFAMPPGEMVSWTSDNAYYNFYISKVCDLSDL